MKTSTSKLSRRLAESTAIVFGESPISIAVRQACARYEQDLGNIESGRGIAALLLAVVGAKGQGKTWVARQFIRDEGIQAGLRSGDLQADATTRLVWVGPVAPDALDPDSEIFIPCASQSLVSIGQPYVLLDTPGLTDADQRAAKLAGEALSLAPVKLLVIARDQLRAATNLTIAHQIEGAICIPVISSVEPDEMEGGTATGQLAHDLRALREQLAAMAPRSQIASEVLVPDFEISGDEATSSQTFLSGVLDRMAGLELTQAGMRHSREQRIVALNQRLQHEVVAMIADELPHVGEAVDQLNRETRLLPQRVLSSLLGSEEVLESGIRLRLRTRLVADTAPIWFPYRTLLSTFNLTQGAWDRVMLALSGSVPSLFGALTSWARNVRNGRDFEQQMRSGISQHTQQQVEERLRPLCEHFHRAILKLRPREDRSLEKFTATSMRLAGIEELQTRSQQIFDSAIRQRFTGYWTSQLLGVVGTLIFWGLMAAPIVTVYREYFLTSWRVFVGEEVLLERFPQPTAGLFFTSLILSALPLAIYCMLVLTFSLGRKKIKSISRSIVDQHEAAIDELQKAGVIRLHFEDELLQHAQTLLNLKH
jgi:hypothetical protein